MHWQDEVLDYRIIKGIGCRNELLRHCCRAIRPIYHAGASASLWSALTFQFEYFALRFPVIKAGSHPLRHSVRSDSIKRRVSDSQATTFTQSPGKPVRQCFARQIFGKQEFVAFCGVRSRYLGRWLMRRGTEYLPDRLM